MQEEWVSRPDSHRVNSPVHKKSKRPDSYRVWKRNEKLKSVCKKNTAITIWVSWYKKSTKIPTDVTEDVIRNYALQNDLVDVKVCSVSAIWSGLKLVAPLAKR